MSFVLRNAGFRLGRCWVPPFELRPGGLVRVYLPNFSPRSPAVLGQRLARQIAAVLQRPGSPPVQAAAALPYARPYRTGLRDQLPGPPTAARYLRRHHRADAGQVRRILRELGLPERQLLRELPTEQLLALALKGGWLHHPAVLFDYYGLGAEAVGWLEQVLAQELGRGKAAIGFDNLQFLEPREPYAATERIIVTEPGAEHPAFG